MSKVVKTVTMALVLTVILMLAVAGVAFADNPDNGKGQMIQNGECTCNENCVVNQYSYGDGTCDGECIANENNYSGESSENGKQLQFQKKTAKGQPVE